MFRDYKRNSTLRGLPFNITREQFESFIFLNCHYCGKEPALRNRGVIPVNGIDRLDTKKGYFMENCVPACSVCNKMKSVLGVDEFLKAVKGIYENQASKEVHKDVNDSGHEVEDNDEGKSSGL